MPPGWTWECYNSLAFQCFSVYNMRCAEEPGLNKAPGYSV